MTLSILVRDAQSGAIGGAAATGSLCVGGWVLRGDLRAGMSASQGAAPSTFWGEDVLAAMRSGKDAATAVAAVTGADRGRAYRQLAALGLGGAGAAFTGDRNSPEMGALVFEGGIVSGNLLTGLDVLEATAEGFRQEKGALGERLIAALRAGEAAGGDSRGFRSAALLVLHADHAPMTLRIDLDPEDPLRALAALHRRASSGSYAEWAAQVPSLSDPERVLS